MIEIIVIACLLAYIAYKEYLTHKERAKLVDRIMAKDLNEVRDLEMAKNVKVDIQKEPDLRELDKVSDEEFLLGVKQEIGKEDKEINALKQKVRKKIRK